MSKEKKKKQNNKPPQFPESTPSCLKKTRNYQQMQIECLLYASNAQATFLQILSFPLSKRKRLPRAGGGVGKTLQGQAVSSIPEQAG